MATEVLTEDDDDFDIVEVDAAPGEEAAAVAAKAEEDAADEEDDKGPSSEIDDSDDDEEDARLADHDDDDEEERKERNRRKSKSQRQRLREAKEAKDREIAALREQIAELRQGQTQLQGAHTQSAAAQLEAQIAETRRDINAADALMADAIAKADGETFAAAQKLRDAARDRERELVADQAQYNPQTPTTDPRIADYAGKWMAANPWYRKDGSDINSALVNSIDANLMREGYDPRTEAYWQVLTQRVKQGLAPAERKERRKEVPESPKQKKAPPLGARGDGGASPRKQVFLSKERVEAIKAAGAWDDPQERAALIKAYEQYDRENSAAAR
jgi:hypothetical protein